VGGLRAEARLDVTRIEAGVSSEEMLTVYRENTARTHALEVSGSPTLYIDGRKHPVWLFRNKVKGQCR
jgi:predicted DsbA family dithiol-disulfide isomerase